MSAVCRIRAIFVAFPKGDFFFWAGMTVGHCLIRQLFGRAGGFAGVFG